MNEIYHKLLEKHPFLSIVRYAQSNEYVCVIQNQDNDITTIYDYGLLRSEQQQLRFLELAEIWYWESSRKIPINIFLRDDWTPFKFCARSLITKEVKVLAGNCVRLEDLSDRRTKRRTITLIKR